MKGIEIDANWVKGFARKGDALLAKKEYTNAYNAYNTGLRLSPNDPLLTEKCEQAMRSIRTQSSESEQSSRSATAGKIQLI